MIGHARPRWSMVLPLRIELRTSPLPRECSTTELRQRPKPRAAAGGGEARGIHDAVPLGKAGAAISNRSNRGTRLAGPRFPGRSSEGEGRHSQLTREQVYILLTDIFRDVLEDETVAVCDTTTAADLPRWDSVMHIALLAAAEVRFGIVIRAVEAEHLANVGDLVDLILRKSPRMPLR